MFSVWLFGFMVSGHGVTGGREWVASWPLGPGQIIQIQGLGFRV